MLVFAKSWASDWSRSADNAQDPDHEVTDRQDGVMVLVRYQGSMMGLCLIGQGLDLSGLLVGDEDRSGLPWYCMY